MPFSLVAQRTSGTNLYMKMNMRQGEDQVAGEHPAGDFLGFLRFFFSSFWTSSSETSAENFSAFMPSDMAW